MLTGSGRRLIMPFFLFYSSIREIRRDLLEGL
jgi:hypothetical protein